MDVGDVLPWNANVVEVGAPMEASNSFDLDGVARCLCDRSGLVLMWPVVGCIDCDSDLEPPVVWTLPYPFD